MNEPYTNPVLETPTAEYISLRDGEEMYLEGIISGGIFWKSLAVACLGLVVGLIAWQLGLLLLIVAGIMFLIAWLTRHYLLLVLTNHRVLVRYGIINLDTTQIHLETIESVEVRRTLIGRFLGYASVVVSGTGSRVLIIPYIENADHFRNVLDELLYRRRQG
ncbi:MAG: PH domain-containing protein [Pseudobdellovibrionaceae bacterium]